MLSFEFICELGRKKIAILLFLHLFLTHDVVTMRGLALLEVDIVDGPPCNSCDEIVCTIATIEPAGSDFKYEKYIADSSQVNSPGYAWSTVPNAKTFQDCASAADTAGSKMFLFNDDECKISPFTYEKLDQCNINQTQMVYIEAEADFVEIRRDLGCNSEIVADIDDDGKVFSKVIFDETAGDCEPKIRNSSVYDSAYIFFAPDYKAPRGEIATECDKFGAKPCAPEPGKIITEFVAHLRDFVGVVNTDMNVGLRTLNGGATFTWATGVDQPTTQGENGWRSDQPNLSADCGVAVELGLTTWPCTQHFYFCCSLPYYP